MDPKKPDSAWEAATWEGSRRAQLRSALQLNVRERLAALEALAETSGRLGALGRSAGLPAPDAPTRDAVQEADAE